ncbi:hypothetical protein OIU34_21160 [Pararhizobium sp. BT-229]|uniref:hypothetical protein n=1 Tax=Pararhizobium sp. BT-229 TaxID=2986923 RepID=UPI0021F7F028|nr:hypothetical protein [Pararhizobium sp. BT-229]MCV9964401.1 hypothetical protein [Pararhizobium sp. BT-229]
MFDANKIQTVIATKSKAGVDLAVAEVSEFAAIATAEAGKIGDFAGELSKANTADEVVNAVISYNALAFQRITAAFARSVERGAEYSRGYREDVLKAFA